MEAPASPVILSEVPSMRFGDALHLFLKIREASQPPGMVLTPALVDVLQKVADGGSSATNPQ
jgi:hypothetical protein